MRAAFFHDHRFGRDTAGVYYSNGALSYRTLSRYLRHFDDLLVVGRLAESTRFTRTIASGPGVEMACVPCNSRLQLALGTAIRRHVREVMARVDAAIIRLPSAIGRVACAEAVGAGKPWMVEVVGCAFGALWNHGSLAGKAIAIPSFVLTRRCVERAPFAVYVSQGYLQRLYPCRGASVGCSNVAIDAPEAPVLRRRLRRVDAGFGARPVALGLVGSLDVDYKGHDTALRALRVFEDAGPEMRLRFLGGGEPSRWRTRAAALGVERNVEFCGMLPGGQAVLEWMDGLDLLLVPSLTEGVPRALVEGMSRALPAIGSTAGGIPELISGSCIHAPRDHRGLARLVARLVADPEELKAQARRNFSKAGEYAADVLEQRRDGLLARFRAYAGSVRA
jgi:hypothetical protein